MLKRKPVNSLIVKLISFAKGEEFNLDASIPSGYLLALLLRKTIACLRGGFRLGRIRPPVLVGRKVVLRCKGRMHFAGSVSIDDHCILDALSSCGIHLGSGVSINKHVVIECTGSLRNIGEGLRIGDHVGIGSGSYLGCAGGVEIGSNTIFGNFVSLHSENHVFHKQETPYRLQGVTRSGIRIGQNCWIGAKATILDGVDLGDGCIIAAGAVLPRGSYEAYGIYGGIPARRIGTVEAKQE
jgi:acetyltransferase-like isoleucine patch superfamily enzyme